MTLEDKQAKMRMRKSQNIIWVDPNMRGIVYALKCAGRVKIGCTVNLALRLRSLNLPYAPDLLNSVEVEDRHWAESYLHRLFRSNRVRGEWFEFSETDISLLIEEMSRIPPAPQRDLLPVEGPKPTTVSITEGARQLRWSREYLYRILHQIKETGQLDDLNLSSLPEFPFRRRIPTALIQHLKLNHRKGKPGRKPKSVNTEFVDNGD